MPLPKPVTINRDLLTLPYDEFKEAFKAGPGKGRYPIGIELTEQYWPANRDEYKRMCPNPAKIVKVSQ
jgi:hypothetical protein